MTDPSCCACVLELVLQTWSAEWRHTCGLAERSVEQLLLEAQRKESAESAAVMVKAVEGAAP